MSTEVSGRTRPSTIILRLALLHWLITLAILSRCFREVQWLNAATVAFVGAAWIEYAALYLLPAILPALLLAKLAGRWPSLRFAAVAWMTIAAAAIQLVLAVDTVVFHMYGRHMDGFVWNLLRTPGGIASMDASGSTDMTFAIVIAGVVCTQVLALLVAFRARALWRQLAPARPLRFAVATIVVLAAIGGGERLAFSFSNLADYQPIVSAHATFPFYTRTRIRKFAAALGLEKRHEERVEFNADGIGLAYPRAPLRMAAERPRWNVVWLVAESWRGDTVEPVVMPRTHAFAQRSLWFRNHFSGGNGTRTGVFAMFYGLYGSYWFPFLSESRGPVVIDQLVADEYQFLVSTSAKFSFPEFDKTVWARLPRTLLAEGTDGLKGWENDRALVDRMLAGIDHRDPARPFFAFHFFESPHAQYWFPDESIIARPYCEDMNYATLEKSDMPLVKNRYLNAVHHLDSQLGRIIDALEQRRLLDSTIVIMTGDHGEEFMEKGRFGHHSDFSDEQIKPPLVLWIPGVPPREVTTVSSHLDLPATLLARLGATNPPDDYSLGLDLLSGDCHDYVVIADWDHLCVRDARFKGVFPVNQKGFFGFEVTTVDDVPFDDHAAYRLAAKDWLLDVMQGQSRFMR